MTFLDKKSRAPPLSPLYSFQEAEIINPQLPAIENELGAFFFPFGPIFKNCFFLKQQRILHSEYTNPVCSLQAQPAWKKYILQSLILAQENNLESHLQRGRTTCFRAPWRQNEARKDSSAKSVLSPWFTINSTCQEVPSTLRPTTFSQFNVSGITMCLTITMFIYLVQQCFFSS